MRFVPSELVVLKRIGEKCAVQYVGQMYP